MLCSIAITLRLGLSSVVLDVPAVSSASAEKVHKDPTSYTAGNLIVPAVNYYGNNGLCKRMPYPSSARQLNKNTPAVKTLADPVFWDVK